MLEHSDQMRRATPSTGVPVTALSILSAIVLRMLIPPVTIAHCRDLTRRLRPFEAAGNRENTDKPGR